jgi:hypothetical protein
VLIPVIIDKADYLLFLPAGLVSDGCTGVLDACVIASMCHDYIYRQKKECTLIDNNNDIVSMYITRKQADSIYRQLCALSWIRKWIRYLTLRRIGRLFWQKSHNVYVDLQNRNGADVKICRHHKVYSVKDLLDLVNFDCYFVDSKRQPPYSNYKYYSL